VKFVDEVIKEWSVRLRNFDLKNINKDKDGYNEIIYIM
jgi:hypothetical protein